MLLPTIRRMPITGIRTILQRPTALLQLTALLGDPAAGIFWQQGLLD